MASISKREWTTPKGEKRQGWEVRHKDGAKHRSKTFRLRKQADAYRQKIERDIHEGVHIPDSGKVTVAVVAERYIRLQEDLAAQVAALVSADLAARVQVLEQAVGTPGMVTFRSKGDARYGSIPDSVQVVTLLGRQFEGDGGAGLYARTADAVPDGADAFTSHGATFLRVPPAADVAAGMLSAGYRTWFAGLPATSSPDPGAPYRNGDQVSVVPAVSP